MSEQSNGRVSPRKRRWFSALLRLYPARFRDRFEGEMLEVLENDLGSRRTRAQRLAFWWRSVSGALRSAPAEHLADLGADLRLVLRSAKRRPLFFAVSAISMGLGIGATATILATISTVFLEPLGGVQAPERLVNVKPYSSHQQSTVSASYPDYQDLAAASTSISGLAGFIGIPLVIKQEASDEPETKLAQATTSNFLDVVGAPPFKGRYFTEVEEQASAATAFVSHWYWTQRMGEPDTLSHLFVNGERYQLVGVGPRGFRGIFKGFPTDVYVPLGARTALGLPQLDDRSARWLELVGRLRSGQELSSAARDFERLGAVLSGDHPAVNGDLALEVEATTGIDADFRGGLLVFLSAFLGIGLLVLAVSVLNVAGMMAARAVERRRDFAVRFALGAPRHRLARLVLTETFILGLLAAAVGLGLAALAARQVTEVFASVDDRIQVLVEVDLFTYGAVLLLVLLAAFLAAFSAGLGPLTRPGTLQMRGSLQPRQRWRRVLVVGQVVLSFVVLAVAGLFANVLQQAAQIPLGFDPSQVAATSINPRQVASGSQPAQAPAELFAETLRRVEELPKVERAALATRVPLSLGARFFPNRAMVRVPGWEPPEGAEGFGIEHSVVSAGYFETMSIRIEEGREFDSRDAQRGVAPVVVNRAFVERFYEDGIALGRQFEVDGEQVVLVGVSANSKVRTLDEALAPVLYLAFEQQQPARGVLIARASGPPQEILGDLRRAQRAVAPEVPVEELETLETRLASALLPQRVGAAAAGALGLLGLLLSATGLYGVLAHWVSSRIREMGLRTSLGARPVDLLVLVLRQGVLLSLAGILVGLPLAAGTALLLRGFLYGLSPLQPVVYFAVAAVMVLAAGVASTVPARRALRISPMEALRT